MSARDRVNGRLRANTDTSAAGFASALDQAGLVLEQRLTAALDGITEQAFRSMVDGSTLTGAPGVPVDTGELHDSYEIIEEGPATRLIASDVVHALAIEYNWGGVTYQNHGPHSRALTYAALPKVAEVVGSAVANDQVVT